MNLSRNVTLMSEVGDPRTRVRAEQQALGWSIRELALRAKEQNSAACSHTAIRNWLNKGGAPTDGVRVTIAAGYGWATDWPTNLPPLPVSKQFANQLDEVERRLTAELAAVRKELKALGGAVTQLLRHAALLPGQALAPVQPPRRRSPGRGVVGNGH